MARCSQHLPLAGRDRSGSPRSRTRIAPSSLRASVPIIGQFPWGHLRRRVSWLLVNRRSEREAYRLGSNPAVIAACFRSSDIWVFETAYLDSSSNRGRSGVRRAHPRVCSMRAIVWAASIRLVVPPSVRVYPSRTWSVFEPLMTIVMDTAPRASQRGRQTPEAS